MKGCHIVCKSGSPFVVCPAQVYKSTQSSILHLSSSESTQNAFKEQSDCVEPSEPQIPRLVSGYFNLIKIDLNFKVNNQQVL